MIKPVTYQGVFNFKSNLYALEVKSRFIDQSKANGYYSGYGNELAATVVDNQIQIGTGAFVVQGRMNEVESTESLSVTIENGKVGCVVARIETYHPSDEGNCTFVVKTAATLDSITLTQEDTYAKGAETSNKVYEFPIYSFEMADGNIINVTKLIKAVADYSTVKTLADDAVTKATTAINTANNAVTTANSATETANTADTNATNAVSTANTANEKSDSAVATANSANETATEAKTIANSASAKVDSKVDKVDGKQLSTNDFTDAYKSNVDSNTTARHTHSNKTILDNTTASFTTAQQTQITTNTTNIATLEGDLGNKLETSNIKAGSNITVSTSGNDVTINAETGEGGTNVYVNSVKQDSVSFSSDPQTQINSKQATITGGATTITSSNLTTSRALISNSSGKVAVSDITSTELGYLDGVTSNIQTQISTKVNSSQIVQTTGTSTTNIMSQNAITNSLSGKVNYSDILQETGTNTDKAMSQKATTDALNKKVEMTTLWSNSSPGNDFSAQNITLSSSDWDFLIIVCSVYKGTEARQFGTITFDGGAFVNWATASDVSYYYTEIQSRKFVPSSKTVIQVENCYYSQGGGKGTLINGRLIPLKIIGVKGV